MNTPGHHPRAFSIGRPIGKGNTHPADMKKLRRRLSELGYLQSPIKAAPRFTSVVGNAVGRFQDDYGLQPDGVITPDGPTEQALNLALATKRTGDPNTFELARKAFAHLNQKGFKFVRDRRDFDAMGAWRDSDGNTASSAEISRALTTFPHRRDLISNPNSTVLFGQSPGNMAANSPQRPGPHQQLAQKIPLGQQGRTGTSSNNQRPVTGTDGAQTMPAQHYANRNKTLLQTSHRKPKDPRDMSIFDLNIPENLKRYFLYMADEWIQGGRPQAGKLLKHFVGGSGKTLTFARDDVRKFKTMRGLEQQVRTNYEEREFLGKTDTDPVYNARLRNLKDGGSFRYTSENNAAIHLKDLPGLFLGGDPDFAYGIGRTQLKGEANFSATRKGNIVYYDGCNTYTWVEGYDFNKGEASSYLPRRLQNESGAKPFKIRAQWKQKFSGTATIKNGVLSNVKIIWTDVTPSSASSPP